jgi:hypothetical protein
MDSPEQSNCWRCGSPTPMGVIECASHCTTQVTHSHGNVMLRKLDWGKVHSIDDIKRIFSVFGMQVVAGSPAEEMLRDFLED